MENKNEPPFDMDNYDYNECLNCNSIWSPGTEEFDMQICSSCGWIAGEPTDEDLTDPEDIDDFDDIDDLNNPTPW